MADLRTHWNNIFRHSAHEQLGWYESYPSQTLHMLTHIPDGDIHTCFLAGVGTSSLADVLRARGYSLILNDVSPQALNALQQRLGSAENVIWLCHDISLPLPEDLPSVDCWIDRAVLHFLTEEPQIQGYFANVHRLIRPGGYLLLAEYARSGARRCAGLPVHRYSVEEMQERLGDTFTRIHHEETLFTTPSGDLRPYVYALFRKAY